MAKALKSINLGGAIMAIAATPGFEMKAADGTLIVKVNPNGEPEVGAGYTLGDDGTVAKIVAPVAPVVDPAQKGMGFTPASLMEMAAKTGQTFKFHLGADGMFAGEMVSGGTATPVAPAAIATPQVDAQKLLDEAVMNHPVVKQLQAEVAAVKQLKNGTSGSDPQTTGAAPVYPKGGDPAPVAKGIMPGQNGNNAFGAFTAGFHGKMPAGMVNGKN